MRVFRQTGSTSVHFLLVDLPNVRGHRGPWRVVEVTRTWTSAKDASDPSPTYPPLWDYVVKIWIRGGGRGGGSHSFIKHQCKLTTQLQTSTGPHCEKSINHRVGPDSIDSIAQFHVDINVIPLGSAVLDGLDTNKDFIND